MHRTTYKMERAYGGTNPFSCWWGDPSTCLPLGHTGSDLSSPSAAAVQRYVLTFGAGAAACSCLRPLEHLWPGTHGSRRRWVPRSLYCAAWFSGCVRFGLQHKASPQASVSVPSRGNHPQGCGAVTRNMLQSGRACAVAAAATAPLLLCSSRAQPCAQLASRPIGRPLPKPFKGQSEPSVPVGVCPRPHQRACWVPGGARAGGHTEQLGCNPALQERAGTHASSLAWPERSGRL